MMNTIIFGPPGTGKTEFLLRKVEEELGRGVAPGRIAFLTFTKSAAEEAITRAASRFGFAKRQLQWFRTLHGMAFAALGCDREAILNDYTQFAATSGLRFSNLRAEESLSPDAGDGDMFLQARSLCAATRLPYAEIQRKHGVPLSGFRYERLSVMLEDYKKQVDKFEYHDLLERFIAQDEPLPVDVAFVDEAQDLTRQQWEVVAVALKNAARVYIAGDDDQAIYEWAGAEANRMLHLPGEQIVLSHSYRLPQKLQRYAQQISARIKERKEKQWVGNESDGEIYHWFDWNELDFDNGESWLLLARCNQFLPEMVRSVEQAGHPYRWCGQLSINVNHARIMTDLLELEAGKPLPGSAVNRLLEHSRCDRRISFKPTQLVTATAPELRAVHWLDRWPNKRVQYLRRVHERHGTLQCDAVIDITTIHQAKGTEADNVVVCPDVTAATWRNIKDAEHRVWYVAATRSKHRIFLCRAHHEYFYRLPNHA